MTRRGGSGGSIPNCTSIFLSGISQMESVTVGERGVPGVV